MAKLFVSNGSKWDMAPKKTSYAEQMLRGLSSEALNLMARDERGRIHPDAKMLERIAAELARRTEAA